MMLAGVAVLLVLAVIAGLVALDQRGDARAEATAAAAQRLGAQALSDASLDRGMLLARQGVALDDSVQTRGNLLATLLKSPAAIGVIGGDGAPLASLDLSPDGRTLALLDTDGTLALVDPRTRRRRRRAERSRAHPAARWVRRGGFSDDGSLLAVAGQQPVVIDARDAAARLRRSRRRRVVVSVAFSADRRSVFATIDSPSVRATTIQRFDAASGRPIGAPRGRRPPRRPNVTLMVVPGRPSSVVTTSDGGPDRRPRRAHAAAAAEPPRRRRRGGAEPGRPHDGGRRPRRHGALRRPRHGRVADRHSAATPAPSSARRSAPTGAPPSRPARTTA